MKASDDDDRKRRTELACMAGELLGSAAVPMSKPFVPGYLALDEPGKYLLWRHLGERGEWWRPVASTDRALAAFLRLETAQDVLDFAGRFGPLMLWETSLEPIAGWLDLVATGRALVGVASDLRRRKPARRPEIEHLLRHRRLPDGSFPPEVSEIIARLCQDQPGRQEFDLIRQATYCLVFKPELDRWLTLGGVRPELSPTLNASGGFSLQLAGIGIFGVLVIRLQLAVAGAQDFARCDACNVFFSLVEGRKHPRVDRRCFCEREECKKAGRRQSQRDRRAKLKK
jgi:hypothetical protein